MKVNIERANNFFFGSFLDINGVGQEKLVAAFAFLFFNKYILAVSHFLRIGSGPLQIKHG